MRLTEEVKKQVEGRSLVPILENRSVEYPDRFLVTHCGRWPRGKVADAKYMQCSIRNNRFTLVNNTELYDLRSDPGETRNVIALHPDVVAQLRAAYDRWWSDIQSHLENENAVGPAVNPFKERYWKQFGMSPKSDVGSPKS